MKYISVSGTEPELRVIISHLNRELADTDNSRHRAITISTSTKNWWWEVPGSEPYSYTLPQDQQTVYNLLNLPLPTPTKTFKVGDKVRIVNNVGAARITIAPVGTITTVVRTLERAMWPYAVEGNGVPWCAVTAENLELVTEDDMKEVIEVGDIVEITNENAAPLNLHTRYEVEGVTANEIRVWDESKSDFWYYEPDMVKLVSKASKKEIIGYELLKDLPGIPAGSKSTKIEGNQVHFGKIGEQDFNCFILERIARETTWFRPIYKPKETVVQISDGREVKIGATHVFLKNQGDISFADVKTLRELCNNMAGTSTALTISVETIKVGCQTFTKADVEAVYKALNK